MTIVGPHLGKSRLLTGTVLHLEQAVGRIDMGPGGICASNCCMGVRVNGRGDG